MTFIVKLNKKSLQTVSVHYATQDGTAIAGSDYISQTGDLIFNARQKKKTLSILIVGDKTTEPDETVKINLSNAVNATITNTTGIGTIINNDAEAAVPANTQT